MLSKSYVDGFLVAWHEGEYCAQVKMLKSKSKPASLVGKAGALATQDRSSEETRARATETRAQAVRDRLDRTTRKVPEVMVKIYSSCKGMKQVGRHMDYISRKGLLDMEDEDGLVIRGKAELASVKEDWRYLGAEIIPDISDRRDTLNIVLSMPANTNELNLKRAVREFAREAFEGHQYVMAYHTPTTDPDLEPPEHPHVHLSVKVQGQDGKRMNPRKADLQRWREGFALKLIENGIEANATSRLARLKRHRGQKRSTLAIQSKGRELTTVGRSKPDGERIERAKALERARLEYYYAVSHVLAQSEDPSDRKSAASLIEHLNESFDNQNQKFQGQNVEHNSVLRGRQADPER